nr:CAP domain-containing protein [Streptomyces sp. Tu 3180]
MFYEGAQPGPKGRCPVNGAHNPQGIRFALPNWGLPSNAGSSERNKVFSRVNDTRRQQQPPCSVDLRVDRRLDGVAQYHSQDLADHPGLWEKRDANNQPGHYGSNNSLPAQRIQLAVGTPGTENVSVHFTWGNATPPTAQAALDSWMDSRIHKANLLNCAHKATGVGFAIGSGIIPAGHSGAGQNGTFYYFTQVFHS